MLFICTDFIALLCFNSHKHSLRIEQSIPDEFCAECPVLDGTQPNRITTMVAFETGCKSIVCKPDLNIDARFIGIR